MNPRTKGESEAYVDGVNYERERIHKMIMDAIKQNWQMKDGGKVITLADIALRLERERRARI